MCWKRRVAVLIVRRSPSTTGPPSLSPAMEVGAGFQGGLGFVLVRGRDGTRA